MAAAWQGRGSDLIDLSSPAPLLVAAAAAATVHAHPLPLSRAGSFTSLPDDGTATGVDPSEVQHTAGCTSLLDDIACSPRDQPKSLPSPSRKVASSPAAGKRACVHAAQRRQAAGRAPPAAS